MRRVKETSAEKKKIRRSPKRIPALEEGNLIAYQCAERPPQIKKAVPTRDWMDAANQMFPYRCLPMTIASQMGWDIINPQTFKVNWNGGDAPLDVKISWPTAKTSNLPMSHFGLGTLTFSLHHLFKTPEGVNLLVMGPPNSPKEGIYPLMGVVETDWLPATFTMNWILTRPNFDVIFEAGEPFCRIIPIPRYITEVLQPQIRMLEENPTLKQDHEKWRKHRDAFNKGLKDPHSHYVKQKWQKDYFQGGGKIWEEFEGHQTHLLQKDFEDLRPAASKGRDQVPGKDVRGVSINLPGGTLTLFIPRLENYDELVETRTNSITAMQSGATRGSLISSPAGNTPNTKSDGDGANPQRGIEELNSGTSMLPNADSISNAPKNTEGGNSNPTESSPVGESLDRESSSDTRQD
jgi:hypothetical protein